MDDRNDRADSEDRMDELEHQAGVDRESIRNLEDQAGVDHEAIRGLQDRAQVDRALIAHLVAEGEIDREKIANLETALVAARRIGAAIGVLMASRKVTDAQAFDLLRTASHTEQRKLRDIAEDVVLTGTLPCDADRFPCSRAVSDELDTADGALGGPG